MRRFKVSELVLGGMAAILIGALYQLGANVENSIAGWFSAPTLNLNVILPNVVIIIGVGAVLYGGYVLRKRKPSPQSATIGLKDSPEIFRTSIFRDGSVVLDGETGKTTLSITRAGRSYALMYDANHNSVQGGGLKIRVRVTPRTLYRFALGVWTSINPLTWENRLGTIEVDNDAFRITYTVYDVRGLGGMTFNISSPKVAVSYIVELEINWGAGAVTGRIYDERNNLLEEMRAPRTVPREALTDVWVGMAVWTDEVGCPLSTYEVENFEVF